MFLADTGGTGALYGLEVAGPRPSLGFRNLSISFLARSAIVPTYFWGTIWSMTVFKLLFTSMPGD